MPRMQNRNTTVFGGGSQWTHARGLYDGKLREVDGMTEADKLRQDRDQWKDEALRLREQLTAASERADIFRRGAEVYSKSVEELRAENEVLKKRLESATEFRFEGYFLRRPLGGRWEVVEPGWNCLFCSLPDASTRPPSCYFDTYEEAEAAALKAMEVAG